MRRRTSPSFWRRVSRSPAPASRTDGRLLGVRAGVPPEFVSCVAQAIPLATRLRRPGACLVAAALAAASVRRAASRAALSAVGTCSLGSVLSASIALSRRFRLIEGGPTDPQPGQPYVGGRLLL